jgi:hypothetical protein
MGLSIAAVPGGTAVYASPMNDRPASSILRLADVHRAVGEPPQPSA